MGILRTVGSSATVRFLFVDTDALEEDGLTVEQDLLTTRLTHTEADAVANRGIVECDLHLIALGVLRAPELGEMGVGGAYETLSCSKPHGKQEVD